MRAALAERMGELDLATKVLLREQPGAFLGLALGARAVPAITPEDATIAASEVRLDKLLRYELEGEVEPRWLHVEIQASPTSEMARRMYDYWSRAFPHCEHLSSLLVCLKSGNRRGDPVDFFDVRGPDRSEILRFRFDVVRVWTIRAEDLLASRAIGLLPFIPYAAGASPASVDEALKILGEVEPVRQRSELQAVLATFAGRVFQGTDWLDRIPREIVMESTFLEQVKALGRMEALHKLLASQMRARLGDRAKPLVKRLDGSSEDTLTRVGGVVASERSNAKLLAKLDQLLPRVT